MGDELATHVNMISKDDLYLFNEGSHYELYNKLGSHIVNVNGTVGTYFAVWAPNARQVSVIGDFNSWDRSSHLMQEAGQSGIWNLFIPGVRKGTVYKYFIESNYNNYKVEKADPFAFYSEVSPKTASIVWDMDYEWNDNEWMQDRIKSNSLNAPISRTPMLNKFLFRSDQLLTK